MFRHHMRLETKFISFRPRVVSKKTKQSPLDFIPDALSLKEFLESDQQQVLHVRMVDGDAWTGLIKVYSVLEKTSGSTNFLTEGQYTILPLDLLLKVNKMMDFNTLMASTETSHLLMISYETNQLFNDETK